MYNAQPSSGVTQLEFNQAMSDFKHMFPDMEEDVIEAVLRANNGVVDATIDQLLQINNESQKKKAAMKNENVYKGNIFVDGPGSSNPKSYSKDLHFLKEHKISKESLRYQRHWQPPLLGELSPDFLRITLNDTQRKLNNLNNNDAHLMSSSFLQQKMEENKRNRQITSMNDDPEMAQYLEDERFAILLQNEEFVRELRMNQDFMSTLESDNHYGSGNAQASNFLDSDAVFKERLRNMGKLSKKKFTQLARLFSGRMRKNFKQLDNSAANHREQYFYQDLSNDNYEDIGASTTTSSNNNNRITTTNNSISFQPQHQPPNDDVLRK